MLDTALKMGVKIRIVSAEHRILEWRWRGRRWLTMNGYHALNGLPETDLSANKEITKAVLEDAGVRVPRGIIATSVPEAEKRMKQQRISFPVVVKPIDGAKGCGVTVDVRSRAAMQRAVAEVRDYWQHHHLSRVKLFMVEEMIQGNDYRVLVLNGKAVACVHRIPAHVIGDGALTIGELFEQLNRTRPASYYLLVDDEVTGSLRLNGYTLDTVLDAGEYVQLRRHANVSAGGLSIDYSATISPRFMAIAQKSAAALGFYFTGIDIMVDDITSNNPRQPYAVIEVNGAPDYDIHEKPVVHGRGRNITRMIIEHMWRRRGMPISNIKKS